MADEAKSQQPRGDFKEMLRAWWIPFAGLILAIGAKPLQDWFQILYKVPAGVPPSRLSEEITYGVEHIGVVLIVGFIIRFAIESASERQWVNFLNAALTGVVTNKLDDGIGKITQTSLDHAREVNGFIEKIKESVQKVSDKLGFTIQKDGILDKDSEKELGRLVFNPSAIRDEYHLILTLEKLKDYPDLVKVRARTQYYVENITEEPAIYPIRAWVETLNRPKEMDKNAPDAAKFIGFNFCTKADIKDRMHAHFDLEELQQVGKVTVDDSHPGGLWFEYHLESGIPPKAIFWVDIEGQQINRKSDLFVWNMAALTKNLKVTVKFGQGLTAKDFQVDARELHHMEDENFQQTREVDSTNGSITWKINQMLLPYQGVSVWWSPVSAPSSEVNAAVSA